MGCDRWGIRNVFGVGVDEHSALLIGADGIGHVADGSLGSAWLVMPHEQATVLTPGQPLSIRNIRLLRLDTSGSVDLGSGTVRRPAAEDTLSIARGTLTGDSIASPIIMRDVAPSDEE